MKSNKTKSAVTALVVAAMLCSVTLPIKAVESQWVNNDGLWSYVKNDNSLATGWLEDGDCWYAFDENGIMRTGWIASHEHWYFMGESGVMQVDAWVEDNGSLYYLKGTGVMAKDYVKDGYELTSDGKAIPLAESNSIVVTDPNAISGEVIEGNLYVDVTAAKEIELSKVIIKGKLVVLGDNETAGKVVLKDSTVDTISNQTRNTEVVLSGETKVKAIVLEETALVTPDKNFNGEVETIEVQSTTKDEIKIEVPTQEVMTRTYASIDIQAPVENLEVITDTQIKVNADVKNVVVTETAKDTKVEVTKGSTIGTLTADAPVKIDGNGTVNKVEVNADGVEAGKDTIIKDVDKADEVEKAPEVNKPSTGGSSGGGGYVPPVVEKGVKNEAELIAALKELTDGGEILIGKNFTTGRQININQDMIPEDVKSFTIDGQGNAITYLSQNEENSYVIAFNNLSAQVILKNIKLTGADTSLLVNGSSVQLEGKVDVSGNTASGIELARLTGESGKSSLDVTKAKVVNTSEFREPNGQNNLPTILAKGTDQIEVISDASNGLHSKNVTGQVEYYLNNIKYEVDTEDSFQKMLNDYIQGDTVVLTDDITLSENATFNEDVILDINGTTITINEGKGSLRISPAKKLEVLGSGTVIGCFYAEKNFRSGSTLKISVDATNEFKVNAKNDNGWAIYGTKGCVIEIDGGIYSSSAIGNAGVIQMVDENNSLTVKNAIVNVETSTVIGATGIYSHATNTVLDNVVVNGNYSACGKFNYAYGKTIISNSKFYTTKRADEGYSAPTIIYQGELEITNSEITRVNVGILYEKPNTVLTSVEGLTYDKNNLFFHSAIDNKYLDIDYQGHIID
ncbi:N-acetylmuramoyl-L-alanine amidase family protein [Dielma fastidiosa]|uniref:Putative cell wall binding repeat protein n=1 Tax=Dielma fastidiosa TaxID=1034346 RepID=A0A318KY17_9FIRM|nr:hypothetical protein [Dielma fastidiosa]PXX80526.1 putative cell wall binding repeat protein [Dielma fastidiosa]